MKLTFLGTKGAIKESSPRHRMHSALLVEYLRTRVLIDCGESWLGMAHDLRPDFIVLTHAHDDHAAGLADGAPCFVYATEKTWELIDDFPLDDRDLLTPGRTETLADVQVRPFPVDHSTRCPAVALRITCGRRSALYCSDVVSIHDEHKAMAGVDLYIGDGATVTRSLVKPSGRSLVGHTPIRTQLTWCARQGVERAIFTHCGKDIVNGDERVIGPKVRRMGEERGVDASIAHDGMTLVLR
jgi:phosphoribosyl 1,2-cyclic phosphodiesterase